MFRQETPGTFRGRSSRYSVAIVAREGQGLAHNGGTPHHPRTRRALNRRIGYGHEESLMLGPQRRAPSVMARLLATGYYDEYRRRFHDAEE